MRQLLGFALALTVISAAALAHAGAIDGPISTLDQIEPLGSSEYRIVFAGGEMAQVALHSVGGAQLTLLVYDEDGTLVASGISSREDVEANFRPAQTGVYTVVVINRSPVPSRFAAATN